MGRPPQIRDWGEQQLLNNQNQNLQGQNALQPGQLEAQKNDLQMQQLQLDQARRQKQDSDTVQAMLAQNNGDFEKTLPQLAGKVSLPTYQMLQKAHLDHVKTLAEIDEKRLNTEKYHADQLSALGDQASKLSDEDYLNNWSSIAQQANQIRPDIGLDPNNPMPRQQFAASLLGLKTTAQYLDQEKARREAKKADEESAAAAAKLPGEKAESTIKQQEAQLTPQERAGLKAPGTLEDRRYEQIVAAQSQGQKVSADDLAWKKGYEKRKTLVPVAQVNLQQSLLTPQAKQALGENFAQTGSLPTGLRSPAMSAQILNEAAKGGDLNIAANKATYTADAGSLKKLQSQFDTVNAFENTAIKNLDQVAKAGAKVPDLGARYANIPVRMISEKMIGTPEMAAFKTALLTAQNEAAKVLTSANASGVLSDSARHEAQQVLDGNLPFPAMMASINQLKTDFANRHQAYQGQIAEIKSRIAKPGEPAAPAASGQHPFFSQFGGQVKP
jgi:hypothetical protein